MKRTILIVTAALTVLLSTQVFANSAPVVSNVSAYQRDDGSGVLDISFKLTDADNDRCSISVVASNDGGSTWTITPSSSALSGALTNVYPGNRSIAWNSKVDLPGVFGPNYRVKVTADDGQGPSGMVWVQINDPGVSGHEGFNGEMSKYETTNAQYCHFLNEALASGDIVISGGDVYGSGAPYDGQIYYDLDSSIAQISYNGSSFYVKTRDGYSMANHPVLEVSWYGSMAFASFYGWRLPTEWEWQAVADYNGTFTYGCGTTINTSIANYRYSTHPHGTTAVGAFGTYGYGMCDMAGNVWEWTNSIYSGSYRLIRGGCWSGPDHYCSVSRRSPTSPYHSSYGLGFRVCR
ncbi:Serine/threonine-protein kinase pkn1 [Sedimentisphaera cyanobacteriorum]|uniref:Serine/threonine-protein kinase pkn1 n=1 Tax=Sedimentisphaera cyanobacteriorum TaxID=1940790 RepID=A0A1Q2HQ96_9BACT|nr:formylglycine-generating enzyme family protein [Sedimentisphaera cyanobacteriorum]AQQ09632.1 Serine/threonine-protein kinase pkn1 [Sedimentisphaera cyanobacteriorum]